MTAILGLSALYHDAAATLLVDGRIVAAAQEERFTRRKHDDRLPAAAISYCLQEAGIGAEELDYVGFYEKPFLKFERLLETYLAFTPYGFRSFARAMPPWLTEKLHVPRALRRALGGSYRRRFIFTRHHESHAASAFFPSPFREAAILTFDGVGEWTTTSFGVGKENHVELVGELEFPHSLGLLYSAFTYYCGFKINDGEYKLMGLAPFGEPRFKQTILTELLDLKPDGSFRMNMEYFNYCQGLTMTTERFHDLFGGPPRRTGTAPTRREMDLAASVQAVTEEIVLCMVRHVHEKTGMRNLCLAGGVALNSVANGRILREGPFENLWIQPAAGDAGGSLGVALFIWHQLLGNRRESSGVDRQLGSRLGAHYGDDEIERFLRTTGAPFTRMEDTEALLDRVADALADGKVVGWFQGRMEFGPRALGCRSILADARNPGMQAIVNRKIKFRDDFRPFAPIVLRDAAPEYFDVAPGFESPYMLIVAPVRNGAGAGEGAQPDVGAEAATHRGRSAIPAVTHVDASARIQTVDAERDGLLADLLARFNDRTGCPVLLNTSFNLSWEPIVASPEDAFRTFMSSGMDLLCLNNYVLDKAQQPARATRSSPAEAVDEVLDSWVVSPCCKASLRRGSESLVCEACKRTFRVEGGIPQLFWPHEEMGSEEDVTTIVKAFYEETPFPNYDDHESLRSLIGKARKEPGLYAEFLDKSIPHNSNVLEVGCGTGQLTNFLGVGCRRVIGADICLNSLRLGEEFRHAHGLERVRFVQSNLFRLPLRPGFDVVLCNGVLHSTSRPYEGFRCLASLLRPGGHIVIGLYNTYGRLLTDLRRQVFRLTNGRMTWIDPILRRPMGEEKRRAWFADQYLHPHESKHTFGEVLRWFREAGIDFVRGVPAMRLEDDGLAGGSLFEAQPVGTSLDRFFAQAKQILARGQQEGGFFVMVGKKSDGERTEAS